MAALRLEISITLDLHIAGFPLKTRFIFVLPVSPGSLSKTSVIAGCWERYHACFATEWRSQTWQLSCIHRVNITNFWGELENFNTRTIVSVINTAKAIILLYFWGVQGYMTPRIIPERKSNERHQNNCVFSTLLWPCSGLRSNSIGLL